MQREVYTTVKEFILGELGQLGPVPINDLLNKGIEKLGTDITDITDIGELAALHIYHVKLDLETRGLIRNVKSKRN